MINPESIRAEVKKIREQDPEQYQQLALYNCDEYAVVYAEKP